LGVLTFQDLWGLHNEHRPLLPRLLLLGLARFTDWNIRSELALNYVLVAGTTLLLQAGLRPGQVRDSRILALGLSVIVFSMGQWANWFTGFGTLIFLCQLLVVLGLFALGPIELRSVRFATALLSGVAATFSWGAGLAFWLAGLPLLTRVTDGRRRRACLLVWGIVAAVTVAAYFHGFRRSTGHPDLAEGIAHPSQLFAYFLVYVGAPLSGADPIAAETLGSVGIAVWLIAAIHAGRQRLLSERELRLAVGLALFAAVTALLAGLARVGFGIPQALSSRYETTTLLFWASLVALLNGIASTGSTSRVSRVAARVLFAAVVVLSIRHSFMVWPRAEDQSDALATARLALRRQPFAEIADDPRLAVLHPQPERLSPWVEILRRYRMSLFRTPGDPTVGVPRAGRIRMDAPPITIRGAATPEAAAAGRATGASPPSPLPERESWKKEGPLSLATREPASGG
jgi:hypothetical protein